MTEVTITSSKTDHEAGRCLTSLDTALGSLSGLLHPGLGLWSHSLDEAEGTNELTSDPAVVDGTRGFCPGTLNRRGVRIG